MGERVGGMVAVHEMEVLKLLKQRTAARLYCVFGVPQWGKRFRGS